MTTEEHGDVGRDAERGAGVQSFPVPRHGRFSLWDLYDQPALGTDLGSSREDPIEGKARQLSRFAGDWQWLVPNST